ncbi:MAG TPA: FecR family protein [Candidatus Dormibacteraeota bacterium]|nr:FecR family protein [Candidatus Dormibacteraeota bacterium]
MSAVARPLPRRRGGRRILIVLVVLILIIAGVVVWLNVAAQAAINVSGTLTVYQPVASVKHGAGGTYSAATTGATVQPGDSVQTDAKGRAALGLPDGTLTRLASQSTITLSSAHFSKSGNLHDVKLLQEVGRTFTNVQHLVSGATFQVAGQSATATVRGTKFEVYITPNGTMVVKLFEGALDFDGKNHVHLVAPEQATADPEGNVGPAGPIQPDPNDPFGPALAASNAVEAGTTPGTEQDSVGGPLHNGETQTYSYSYAGGALVKGSLGYPGSAMKLTIKAPDNQTYTGTGPSPIVVVVNNGPPGIYTITVTGVSGLGPNGEEPFLAVASVEACATADVESGGAVHRGYTAQDLSSTVNVTGLTNLHLTINGDSTAGAIINGSGTYNGVGWSGSVVMVARNGTLDIMAVGAQVFGMSVPAQQIASQIATTIGQDPSSLNPGFAVDRVFTCNSVLMIDGRTA